MDFTIQVSVYYKPLICFCIHVRFHLLSNLWLDSKNEWCLETAGRASNINIRLAKHSHLSIREEPQHTNTCDQPCRPDRTRQVAGQGGATTHTHMRPTLPARPHSAGRRSGRSRNTHTHVTNPAGQTALGRSPVREKLQHICMQPNLMMRPHSKCIYSTSSPL